VGREDPTPYQRLSSFFGISFKEGLTIICWAVVWPWTGSGIGYPNYETCEYPNAEDDEFRTGSANVPSQYEGEKGLKRDGLRNEQGNLRYDGKTK